MLEPFIDDTIHYINKHLAHNTNINILGLQEEVEGYKEFVKKLELFIVDTVHFIINESITVHKRKTHRSDIMLEEVERYKGFSARLKPLIVDTVQFIYKSMEQKKRILVEGSQRTMLDIEFGACLFVTSSNTSAGGICSGLGIPPKMIDEVCDHLRSVGHGYGTTTGHPDHRCGWLDIVALKYGCQINELPEIKFGVTYTVDDTPVESFPDDHRLLEQLKLNLPKTARSYVERVEELTGVPTHYIGVGPGHDAIIFK
ncbi:hypothetical protein ACOSP7_031364 [Xanthoceras sorbifolium]